MKRTLWIILAVLVAVVGCGKVENYPSPKHHKENTNTYTVDYSNNSRDTVIAHYYEESYEMILFRVVVIDSCYYQSHCRLPYHEKITTVKTVSLFNVKSVQEITR